MISEHLAMGRVLILGRHQGTLSPAAADRMAVVRWSGGAWLVRLRLVDRRLW